MTDLIKVGFAVETDGIEQGEVALKRLSQAGEQVDKSFKKSESAAKATGDASGTAGKKADTAAKSFGSFAKETKNLAGATGGASSGLRSVGDAADESGRKVSAMGSALKLAKASIIGLAAGLVSGAFKSITDEATDLESRLKQVVGSADGAADAMDRLRTMARTTYSDFANTTESFLSMSGSLKELGYSTNQQLDYIESLNNALVVSGAKAENAASVQYALSKAMALGKLSGIELNTVIATGGRVAELLAEKLGTTVSGLRALGAEGRITSDVMYGALAGSLEKVRAEAEAMPATIGDGMLLLGDSIKQTIVQFDQMFGISSKLSDGLVWLADNIKVIGVVAVGAGTALAIAFAPSILASVLALGAGVVGLGKSLALLMYSNPFTAIAAAITTAVAALTVFRHDIKAGIDDTTTLGDIGTEVWSRISGAISGSSDVVTQFGADGATALNGLDDAGRQAAENQEAWWLQAVRGIAFAFDAIGATIRGFFAGTYDVAKAVIQSIGNDFAILGQAASLALRFDFEGAKAKLAEGFKGMDIGGVFGAAMESSFSDQQGGGFVAMLDSILKGAQVQAKTRMSAAGKDLGGSYVDGIVDSVRNGSMSIKQSTELLIKALKDGTINQSQYNAGLTQSAAAHRALTGATDGTVKATKAATKAAKEQKEQIDKTVLSIVKNTDSIKQGNAAMRLEVDSIGKTNRELVAMEQQRNRGIIAQLREVETSIRSVDGREAETAAIREQISALEDRNQLLGERIDTQEVYESQKKIADQWQSLSDDMGRTFTDAIINGGANAKEAIKRMFTNMVLRPIIEPIAQGVAGMFTQMLGGGQGGGGLLGGLFGGGGSGGGGGFNLGNIASMGQSIYSAFTGWGKAALAGWQSGGITGAIQGFGGYVTGGIQSASSAIAALFGKGAAASAGGTGFGLGGSLVSGSVGNASYAGASSSSSMAAAWPLAVIAGMIQSAKLFDAGVRADGGKLYNDFKDKGVGGKAYGAATGVQGKINEFADGLIASVTGDKIAAIITGSPITQWVSEKLGAKLFGGPLKTKYSGLELGVTDGQIEANNFQFMKGKKGLFGGGKKKLIRQDLDEETMSAFTDAFDETLGGVTELFKALSFDVSESVVSGISIGLQAVNTLGLTEEASQEAIEKWFTDAAESINTQLNNTFDTGLALDLAGMQTLVGNMLAVNATLDTLGLASFGADVAGAKLAETLIGLSGGLDGLMAATESYYQGFYTEEEKSKNAMDAMTKAMADAGLEAVDSREAYRKMVDGIDLTSTAGQEMFTKMMNMAGLANEYFGVLESQAAELAAQAAYIQGIKDQLAGMKDGLDAVTLTSYQAALVGIATEYAVLTEVLKEADLATEENSATLASWANQMSEMAALDLFQNGQDIANTLRDGLLGNWDGGNIGNYIAQSISDGVYGAIAGEFSSQITNILLQGIVAPMINAAMTGASISEAVSKASIAATVAQAQAVAGAAAEVMKALADSGVLEELQKAMGGLKIDPVKSKQLYSAPVAMKPIDDSWKRILESIINRTKAAEKTLADMGRSTYEKGLADIAALVADYQSQIAASTNGNKRLMAAELLKLEQSERKLLEAQIDQRATDTLSGINKELARMGKTDAQIAMMDINDRAAEYIKSLEDIGRATTGNIEQVNAWADAMREAAAKDAQIKSAGGAYDALGRAVDAQRKVITEALELARDVADTAGNASKDLFASVLSSSTQGAEQARKFIADSLSNAQSTGYLPDSDALRSAIDAATRGFDDAAAQSVAASQFDKLVLANQLQQLAAIAEPQANYAQEQLNALDAMLENAKGQLDVLQGIDTTVLTVAEALERFNQVMGANEPVTLPDSPVFTPAMPPQPQAPDNSATVVNTAMLAEVVELREALRDIQRETKRTADAVNGRGDSPILVEVV